MKKPLWITGLIMLVLLTVTACATIETATTLATAVGEHAGVISHSQAESVRKSTVAVSRSLEDFTPEQ